MMRALLFSVKKIFKVYRILKRIIFTLIAKASCGSFMAPIAANGLTILTKSTALGKNVHFNGLRVSGAGAVCIGDNFHSGSGCLIITQNHNIHGEMLPYDATYIVKTVIIGDNVWLGSRVIILPGVKVGEGAVIQAGSVVVSDIPPLSIAGGHPCKVFSMRNFEHYSRLKKMRKFG